MNTLNPSDRLPMPYGTPDPLNVECGFCVCCGEDTDDHYGPDGFMCCWCAPRRITLRAQSSLRPRLQHRLLPETSRRT
jgi:hypothetical protein